MAAQECKLGLSLSERLVEKCSLVQEIRFGKGTETGLGWIGALVPSNLYRGSIRVVFSSSNTF